MILTPDRRIRVFVSSTLQELAAERAVAREAIERLRFTPVLFELGARPHPPRALYRAYLEQSDVFVGVYWQRYGWVAPGMEISGLEDEYLLAHGLPKLVYVKQAVERREPGLEALLGRIRSDDVSYRRFETPEELATLIGDDLALLVSERFARAAGNGARRLLSLPAPASSFVGRESEVEAVVDLLRRGDVRLVTLTGPGGIGKTRLALEAARRLGRQEPLDVAFVGLAKLSEPDEMPRAIAQALEIPTEEAQSALESVEAYLAERELILVLDNLEHLLAASSQIATLLWAAPGLRVLATSRARLGISGEYLYPVPPMSLPEADARGAAAVERSDAVRLFAVRAQAAGWTTTDADAPIVADIVRRLDGLPLAIELAAAQARLVPAELVHARLRRRLDLAGGPRDAEERHRTLRSTIAWSYDLLDEPARQFFEALSVFVGGFSLEASAIVVDNDQDVDDLLATLVDSSLVAPGAAMVSEVRFAMLETIREYAAERLDDRGGGADAARRHLAYFADLADDAFAASPQRLRTTRLRLDEERGNLRAALLYATRNAPTESVRLAGALGGFFSRRGLAHEGRKALADALAAAPDAPAKWRARALVYAGWLAAQQDECDEADRQASEALALYRELGDARGVGVSFNTLGYSAATRGDDEQAIAFYEESRRSFADFDYDWQLYAAANLASAFLASRRDLDRARSLFVEALAFFDPNGFEDEAAMTRLRLGELEEVLGNQEAARRWSEEAVAAARRTGNRQLLSWALTRLGHVDATGGRIDDGIHSYAEALELHREVGHRLGIAYCLECVARIALLRGEAERGALLLGGARAIRRATGLPTPELEQREADETEREMRTKLGDALFEGESAAGAALGTSELLALAGGPLPAVERAS